MHVHAGAVDVMLTLSLPVVSILILRDGIEKHELVQLVLCKTIKLI